MLPRQPAYPDNFGPPQEPPYPEHLRKLGTPLEQLEDRYMPPAPYPETAASARYADAQFEYTVLGRLRSNPDDDVLRQRVKNWFCFGASLISDEAQLNELRQQRYPEEYSIALPLVESALAKLHQPVHQIYTQFNLDTKDYIAYLQRGGTPLCSDTSLDYYFHTIQAIRPKVLPKEKYSRSVIKQCQERLDIYTRNLADTLLSGDKFLAAISFGNLIATAEQAALFGEKLARAIDTDFAQTQNRQFIDTVHRLVARGTPLDQFLTERYRPR